MMRWLLVAVLLLAQAPEPEQYPGQRNHQQPPVGYFCEHMRADLSTNPENNCACERSCDFQTGKPIEDKSCSSWCYPDACKCEMSSGAKKMCRP